MTTAQTVVPIHVLGVDVDIHLGGVDVHTLEEAVRDRWHLTLRRPGEPAGITVSAALVEDAGAAGGWEREDRTVEDVDIRRLLQRLTQNVTFAVIRARTGELLMLHAAALADPVTGATAVFVAKGNTGKTTLCRTLGPRLSYLTDETMGMNPDGSIDPYAKPLSTRRPDWQGVKDEQAPGSLGLVACPVTPWLAGIVLLDRVPEHEGEPVVEELDTLHAVADLIPESSGFMSTEAPLQWLASVLERTGGARRVTYSEVESIWPLVREICDRSSMW